MSKKNNGEYLETLHERFTKYVEQLRQKQLQKEEYDNEIKRLELNKKNVILMLNIHRDFTKACIFGHYEILSDNGSEFFESEEFKKIKDSKLIDFTTFVHFMATDNIMYSYCEDIGVCDFANNLSERYEYFRNDLEWHISIIDVEILFNFLRENLFITEDTPRSNFFEIFNPNLKVFENPIEWKDIKELAYFLDKCISMELINNSKYQSIIEKFKMFKTKNSKGDYLKSNSIRTTLSNVKNETLTTKKFTERVMLINELLEEICLR